MVGWDVIYSTFNKTEQKQQKYFMDGMLSDLVFFSLFNVSLFLAERGVSWA